MQGVYSPDRGDVRGVGVPEGQEAGQVQAIPGRAFYSVDSVLRWAYEVDQYRGPKVSSYNVRTAQATGGDRLSSLDRLAQAACIQARIERLPDEQRELVCALYSWGAAAPESINRLCRRGACAIDLGPVPVIEALVLRYCRASRKAGALSLRTIALTHGVPWSTVRRREERVREWLGRLWNETEARLYREWYAAGLILP